MSLGPYRLGDMIRHRIEQIYPEGGAVHHHKTWPDSIVSKYLETQGEFLKSEFILHEVPSSRDFIDLKNLAGIVNEFPKNLKPKDDELVIHLRLGDVLESSDLSAQQILSIKKRAELPKEGHLRKTMILSFYENLPLEKLNISKIILMTGSSEHVNKTQLRKIKEAAGSSKSEEYVNIVKSFFEKSGYRVDTRFGFTADEDFVFACRAKMFVPSRSGFAILAEKVRKHLGYESYS